MCDISLKDIKVLVPNKILIEKSDLIISFGRKYGLIGKNGTGKSTLLKKLYNREFKIPTKLDMFYVEQEEIGNDDKTVYESIYESNIQRKKLFEKYETLEEQLNNCCEINEELLEKYNRISEKIRSGGYEKDESTIRKILYGLGFTQKEQNMPTSQFSGGWKMRISLAKALYLKPKLLLLDEPTNHLDLNAVIWLTNYLIHWKNSLIVISHDRNFLNSVCTDILQIENCKLNSYRGNYDSYLKIYKTNISKWEKDWEKFSKIVKAMKKKNKNKDIIDKYVKENMVDRPPKPYKVSLRFCFKTYIAEENEPILEIKNLSFGFDNLLYENCDLIVKSNDRISIVGKNGVGKSTLFQIIQKKYEPMNGYCDYDNRLRIGYYHQHATDVLPLLETAVSYIQSLNSEISVQEIRKHLGTVGLDGKLHNQQMQFLSGGQKSRVLFVSSFVCNPHLLLLDEPTNHLDIETIDALIKGINNFEGAVIMITHNINIIEKTGCQIYELSNKNLNITDFETYQSKILDEIENY